MNIPNELLGEVLGKNVQETWASDSGKFIHYDFFMGDNNAVGFSDGINIYELAHMCKKYLIDKGYTMCSIEKADTINIEIFYNDKVCYRGAIMFDYNVAIFKATQWVYDNANNPK